MPGNRRDLIFIVNPGVLASREATEGNIEQPRCTPAFSNNLLLAPYEAIAGQRDPVVPEHPSSQGGKYKERERRGRARARETEVGRGEFHGEGGEHRFTHLPA
jgi:hypothetical protein